MLSILLLIELWITSNFIMCVYRIANIARVVYFIFFILLFFSLLYKNVESLFTFFNFYLKCEQEKIIIKKTSFQVVSAYKFKKSTVFHYNKFPFVWCYIPFGWKTVQSLKKLRRRLVSFLAQGLHYRHILQTHHLQKRLTKTIETFLLIIIIIIYIKVES